MLTEDKPVNILDHFKEIKKRLIRYFIFLTIFTVGSLIFFKQIQNALYIKLRNTLRQGVYPSGPLSTASCWFRVEGLTDWKVEGVEG